MAFGIGDQCVGDCAGTCFVGLVVEDGGIVSLWRGRRWRGREGEVAGEDGEECEREDCEEGAEGEQNSALGGTAAPATERQAKPKHAAARQRCNGRRR